MIPGIDITALVAHDSATAHYTAQVSRATMMNNHVSELYQGRVPVASLLCQILQDSKGDTISLDLGDPHNAYRSTKIAASSL
jgi:hypothetical protein